MKIKIELKKSIILISIPLGIFILSGILSSISFMRMESYIEVDGKTISFPAYKNIPLSEILKKVNISLGEEDTISKPLDSPLAPLQTAEIIRIKKERRTIYEKVPFRITWSRQYNSNLRKTELQKGIEKTITKDVIETFHNNILYEREVLRERSIAKEYYRLALITDDNKVEKIYDLTKKQRMNMVATAYYPGDPLAWGDGTVTFLGQKMQRGIIAVDPKVIPLRTRLFVSGYGYGYAGDTGNLIKGDRVDLGVNNAQEELSWMFRDVIVYILEPSNTW